MFFRFILHHVRKITRATKMIKNPVVSPIVDPVQLVISSLESLKKFSSHVLQKAIISSIFINENAILSVVVSIGSLLNVLLLNGLQNQSCLSFQKRSDIQSSLLLPVVQQTLLLLQFLLLSLVDLFSIFDK